MDREEKGMELIVRLMEEKDIPALLEMEQAIFSKPWSEQNFREVLTKDYNIYMVAQKADKIVGCVGLTKLDNEGDIDKVMVSEEDRGCGVASYLMGEILEEAKGRGVEEFTLEVRVSNLPAIRLYEKFGFVSEGIRPGFYEKPVEDAMIMWLRQ